MEILAVGEQADTNGMSPKQILFKKKTIVKQSHKILAHFFIVRSGYHCSRSSLGQMFLVLLA